jgi:hypothetical protein
MPYSYYQAINQELNPLLGEYVQLEWTAEKPQIGKQVFFGSQRIWNIIDIIEYHLAQKTEPEFVAEAVIFLNCCAVQDEVLTAFSQWAQVKIFQENPLAILQIFISPEQSLIQTSVHFCGKKAVIGSYLREYDHRKHEFIHLPWQVSRIDSYLPNLEQKQSNCYAAIYIVHCIPSVITQSYDQSTSSILDTMVYK